MPITTPFRAKEMDLHTQRYLAPSTNRNFEAPFFKAPSLKVVQQRIA